MSNIEFFGNNRGIAIYENYMLISADDGLKFGECEYNYPNALYLCKFVSPENGDCCQFQITNLQPIITYDYKRDGYQQANLLVLGSGNGNDDEIYITANVDKAPASFINSTNGIVTENNLPIGYYLIYVNESIHKRVDFYDGYDNIYMTYDEGFIYYYSTFTGDLRYNNTIYTSTTNVHSFVIKSPRRTLNGNLYKLDFPIKNLFVDGNEVVIYGNRNDMYFRLRGTLENDTFVTVEYENQKLLDAYYTSENEYILYMENEMVSFRINNLENQCVIYNLDLNTDSVYLVDYRINYDRISGIYNITGCNVGDLRVSGSGCFNIDKPDNQSYLFIINFMEYSLMDVVTIDNIFDLSEQYSFFNNYLLYILANNKKTNMKGDITKYFVFNKINYQSPNCVNLMNDGCDCDDTDSVGSWHN